MIDSASEFGLRRGKQIVAPVKPLAFRCRKTPRDGFAHGNQRDFSIRFILHKRFKPGSDHAGNRGMFALRRLVLGKSVMPVGKADGRFYGHDGILNLTFANVTDLRSDVNFFIYL